MMYKEIYRYPIYQVVTNMYQGSREHRKHLILDPLTCVLRLILLQYKARGTKISILENGISYNPPTLSQGFLRAWYGDNREDLHNLCSPIHYFKKWYPRENPQYTSLHAECVQGLYVLRESYDKKTTIYHTLTHYTHILQGYVSRDKEQEHNESALSEDKDIDIDKDIEKQGEPGVFVETPSTENPLIDHLKHLWTQEEVDLMMSLLVLVSTHDETEGATIYLRTLEDILSSKEARVHEFIQEMSTSY